MSGLRSNIPERRPRRRRAGGFTLVEVVGVLAILALLAGTFAPSLARRISRARGEKEDAALAVLAEGLVRAVRTHQRIPGPDSWVADVAGQTGLSEAQVRHVDPVLGNNPRVYLVHPGFQPSTSPTSDPVWVQGAEGTASLTEARILILSSHKSTLAVPVTSGRAASPNVFAVIWNWTFDPATRMPPSGWPAEWNGNGEYLHVERINLINAFHRVTYSNAQYPDAAPEVRVGAASFTLDDRAAGDAWFLHGTVFRLHKDADDGGDLDLSHTLVGPMNFVYADHRWAIP